jgi:hypothetical protein
MVINRKPALVGKAPNVPKGKVVEAKVIKGKKKKN